MPHAPSTPVKKASPYPSLPRGLTDDDRPASRDELLVVQVHLVGGVVPRVVRAAVDVDEKGPGTLLLGVADDPAVHLDAVADREGALGVRVALHVGEPVAVVGAHGLGARCEVDRDDLAERLGW